jgi:formate hydrogenlyase subunit 3/multisubunit Na+/H+ antiporter MnhD subunit
LSAPLIWIVLPVFISVLLLIFRKHFFLICLVQIICCLFIFISATTARFVISESTSIFTYQISPDMNILGRSLVFTTGLKNAAILFYGALGIWSISIYILKIETNIVPFGMAFIGLLISALAVEPFLYSALIMEIAVIVSIPIVANSSNPRVKGVSRYLIYFTLGMPFVLLAGWYLAGGEITPVNDEQLIQAALLLGLGFVFWLAVFPFQSWMPLLADESEPIEGFFVLTILPMAVAALLMKYLNGFAWLRGFGTVFLALRLFGLIMIVIGSIWFSMQKKLRKAIGYLVLVSSGFMVVAIGLNTSNGYIFSSYLMLLRVVCFFVISIILMMIEKLTGNRYVDSLEGLFSHFPLVALSFFIPLVSLAGMPLTLGFPVMQGIFSEFSLYVPRYVIYLILSQIILSVTIIRWIFISMKKTDDKSFINNLGRPETVFLLVCILGLIILGLFPNIIYPRVGDIVNDLQFLIK